MMVLEAQAAAEESSGWTSYLDCPSSTSSLLSDSSFTPQLCQHPPHNIISTTNLLTFDYSDFQVVPDIPLSTPFNAVPQKGNSYLHDEDAIKAPSYMALQSDELDMSCGSSTVSDANSPLGCHSHQNQTRSKQKRKRLNEHSICIFAANPAVSSDLEDTATSSPCSDQVQKCNRLDIFSCDEVVEGGDVSKRFKALQALIPCLKEMGGKGKEEEMLNAIISHVRDLEQKVQLLSDVWHLTQLNCG
ncbi:hypothetical protein L7F22_004677 [Adiantum nelumboides]|nr:hypothetical protein [Adiantum nelumboides]